MHFPTDRIMHSMAFVIPAVEYCLEHKKNKFNGLSLPGIFSGCVLNGLEV